MLANDTMKPNCNFLKVQLNSSLNTICFYCGRWSFSILISHTELQRWGPTRMRSFSHPYRINFWISHFRRGGGLMTEFHEKTNKNDQSSRNNHKGIDSEERQEELRLFSVEKWRERSDMMSAFKHVFSDTSRPARERTGNSLTSVFMSDKTSNNVLRGIMQVQLAVWVVV